MGGGGGGHYEISFKIDFMVVLAEVITSARNNIFPWEQKQLIDITPLLSIIWD